MTMLLVLTLYMILTSGLSELSKKNLIMEIQLVTLFIIGTNFLSILILNLRKSLAQKANMFEKQLRS